MRSAHEAVGKLVRECDLPGGVRSAGWRTCRVFWVGLIHGILFTAYAVVAVWAWGSGHLPIRLLGLAALASVLPFGPFVIDRRLKSVEHKPDAPEEVW
jgi:integral membrane protein